MKIKNRITKENLSKILMSKALPEPPSYISLGLRDSLIKDFGIFGLPTRDSVIELLKIIKGCPVYDMDTGTGYLPRCRPVYDMGAGCGYLSYCLKEMALKCFSFELEITAIDNYQTKLAGHKSLKEVYRWHTVLIQDALTITSHIRDSVVIMNWPDQKSGFAYNLARTLHKSNELIYIGEGDGGCSANDKFFETFSLEFLDIPWYAWQGLHDQCYRVGL